MSELVSFEIAKLCLEKGMEQNPENYLYSSFYEWDGLRKIHSLVTAERYYSCDDGERVNMVFAPTISQVLDWFITKHHIAVNIDYVPYCWQYKVYDMTFNDRFAPFGYMFFESKKDASLSAIEKVLTKKI